MAKIITVTANTAIDLVIEVEALAGRDTVQATRCNEYVCGKGINVAKALESLRAPSLCLGFAGRQSAHLFDGLDSDFMKIDLIPVDGKTRTNVTLFDAEENKETHIRTSGYLVTPDHCRQLARKLDSYVEAGDIAVFSGSLPPGAPKNLYETLIGQCRRKSALTFLDAGGKALAEGLKAKPYLVKPNLKELEELAGKPLTDVNAVAEAARDIIEQGVSWVFVSMAEKGAIAVGGDAALTAIVNRPFCRPVTHVGCGDALVAGLAASLLENKSLEETLKRGVACGTANLYSSEPGRLNPITVSEIFRYVEINKI
ncbi:MAG: 1-phosphofructokinase family hexose kinase [Gammaproteobacteria bacterium]